MAGGKQVKLMHVLALIHLISAIISFHGMQYNQDHLTFINGTIQNQSDNGNQSISKTVITNNEYESEDDNTGTIAFADNVADYSAAEDETRPYTRQHQSRTAGQGQ